MLTGEQIKAGRALVRWDQSDLSKGAGVSVPTIKRLEGTSGYISANNATEAAIKTCLEAAGVIFIDENGEGSGVRLRKGSK